MIQQVRDVLFREWDPIGVNANEQSRDEYASYAPGICRLLREGVDEYRLAAHLGQLMRVSMGLSRIDEERNRRIARRLLDFTEPSRTR